ncbi:MAG: exodeoxyribonuclease VII large subunit [Gammaproteobacteria bacterium]|nr:exodeoxyribonuclease VII large subunit [Gammaproteobacteria bacterium]
MHKSDTQTQRQIFTVGKLNHYTKRIIEGRFPLLWIEGEISNLTKAASGHWYFTLKDDQAQVRCIMFKQAVIRSNCPVENGDKVLVHAQATFYEPRGDFQLMVENLEDAGIGALQRAYQALYNKLQDEGLFDPTHKKVLTEYPNEVALITSDTGAAIHDLLTVFESRCPLTKIILIPAVVQGKQAPRSLLNALKTAESIESIDAIIIGRGGGSLEDLWGFNDEQLARAVFDCPKLVVSAVGHESDVTIIDYVADIRAATPSRAAELLSPDSKQWLITISQQYERLARITTNLISKKAEYVAQQQRLLTHPAQKLRTLSQHLDYAMLSLEQSITKKLRFNHTRCDTLAANVKQHNPMTRLVRAQNRVSTTDQRMHELVNTVFQDRVRRFEMAVAKLNGASPLATLSRGYGFVTKGDQVITHANQVTTGDELKINWQDGARTVEVKE